MIRQPISRKTELFLGLLSIGILLGSYSILSYRQHLLNPKDTTIPTHTQFIEGWKKIVSAPTPKFETPAEKKFYTDHKDEQWSIAWSKVTKFWPAVKQTWLVNDFYASGKRLFYGLLCGISLSFFFGLSMGVSRPMEALSKWPVLGLGAVPPTAMLAVYLVVFGTEIEMYTAMVALGITPALTVAIFNAVRTDVTDHAIYKAYTLGASTFEVIWEVVVKQILPRIIDFIRLAIGPAMVFLIAAEMNNADVGFGYRLRIQGRLTNMSVVYTYLVLLGLVGFMIDNALLRLRRWLCPWFDMRA